MKVFILLDLSTYQEFYGVYFMALFPSGTTRWHCNTRSVRGRGIQYVCSQYAKKLVNFSERNVCQELDFFKNNTVLCFVIIDNSKAELCSAGLRFFKIYIFPFKNKILRL